MRNIRPIKKCLVCDNKTKNKKYCSTLCYYASAKLRVKERFLSKIKKTEHCWLWNGGYFNDGYPAFYLGKQNERASRISYELFIGNFKKELHILHTCDNPKCVNPSHLYPGTHSDNMRDKVRRGKGSSKLKEEDVRNIRKLKGKKLIKDIAKIYNIDACSVSQILNNKSWGWI